jgi:hypothetical protein
LIRCGFDESTFYRDQAAGHPDMVAKAPFEIHVVSDFSCAPGLFGSVDLDAAGFPVHLRPLKFDPEVDLLHVFEMLRRTPCARFPGDPLQIMVGGHALLTRVGRDGITQKMLAEYDDAIGEPIQRSAPLNWKQWRAERKALSASVQ